MERNNPNKKKKSAGQENTGNAHESKVQPPDLSHKKEGLFVLEAASLGNKLKVSGFERAVGEERPVKGYKEITYNEKKVKDYTKNIIDLLNRANRRGKISSDLLIKLKELGRLMFDELIPVVVKDGLVATNAKSLMVSVDDRLVFIPWELLHDGNRFFCQRFAIGRSVSTKQQVSSVARVVGTPLKMQLLADPGGDLKASYEEGVEIKNEIGRLGDYINVSLKSTDIRTDFVKSKIRNFDIVHYAGHADHNSAAPEQSGWILKDGKLSAEEVMRLAGSAPMPSLVFSNACQSGQTEAWKIAEDYENRIFGLANAFLLAGVQHYIGTFWEIPDEAGSYFAIHFYKNIVRGVSVGESIRQARMELINKYGEDTIVWASYMLYGDPTTRYIHSGAEVKEREPQKYTDKAELVSSELRHKEEVIQIGGEKAKSSNMIFAGAALLIIAVLALFVFKDQDHVRKTDNTSAVVAERDIALREKEASRKRIDELVSSLAKDYRGGKFDTAKNVEDEWSSRPVTIVFMDVKSIGSIDNSSSEKLLSLLPLSLQGDERVKIVEREVLDKLLDELKLSQSDLANPLTSLKIGKLFSAKLIMTGTIIPDKQGLTIISKLIDTETSQVRNVIKSQSPSPEVEMGLVNDIGNKISTWVKDNYPLKGRIVSVAGDRCQINLGQMHGLKKGDRLEILTTSAPISESLIVVGEVEVSEVERGESSATILGNMEMIKEGTKLREKKG